MLPRHNGLDVRGLVEQDLLLLRALCLSPIVTAAAEAIEAAEHPRNHRVDRDGADEGQTVATCWRLHVSLLLNILSQVPAAADDNLAVVEHVALPCLDILASICLEEVEYPSLKAEDGDASTADKGDAVTGSKVEDFALRGVLRASANSWILPASPATVVGVNWTTPSQMRNAQLVRNAWGRLTAAAASSDGVGHSSGARALATTNAEATEVGSDGVNFVPGHNGSVAWHGKPPPARFPEHWLLRLMTCRQSPVLRSFSSRMLGVLAISKGPETSNDVAEVAAHLLGYIGAEGCEAAVLQVG